MMKPTPTPSKKRREIAIFDEYVDASTCKSLKPHNLDITKLSWLLTGVALVTEREDNGRFMSEYLSEGLFTLTTLDPLRGLFCEDTNLYVRVRDQAGRMTCDDVDPIGGTAPFFEIDAKDVISGGKNEANTYT